MLTEVFGPPESGGLLDAGCGPGHQAVALAKTGYRVIALDAEEEMIDLAVERSRKADVDIQFVRAVYGELPEALDAAAGCIDGVLCVGNALAATGDRQGCREAVRNFAAVLRPGGKLFVQIVNFRAMRNESPCVRGPRIAVRDGIEYISVRHFMFLDDICDVTNVTIWNDGQWRKNAHTGRLYPIDHDELLQWCGEAGLEVEACYGGYGKKPFDISEPGDLIVVATRVEG
ncbi:MAG: methyltransferase domain-containing protein [Planctomycetes bacterium]|nr:methyltransferase domain-containing protein [Planctomycetota bacterium]